MTRRWRVGRAQLYCLEFDASKFSLYIMDVSIWLQRFLEVISFDIFGQTYILGVKVVGMAKVLFRVSYDLAWLPMGSCVETCCEGVSSSTTNLEGGGKHASNTPIMLAASTIHPPTDAMKDSGFVTSSYQLACWVDYAQPRKLINHKTLGVHTIGLDHQSSGVIACDN